MLGLDPDKTAASVFNPYLLRKELEFSKSSILKRKKKSEVTKTSPQSELEPGSLAQESSDFPPELSASWRMQLEKDRSCQFGRNGPLYKRSQSTDVDKKLSFRTFQV